MATRYISTALEKPVISSRRAPKPAPIPPFSFVGELEIGVSGIWYPTYSMELRDVSVTAANIGSGTAQLFLIKQEPYALEGLVIAQLSLPPTTTKIVQSLNDINVTPYDKVFIASFVASGHVGVVVQMVGTII